MIDPKERLIVALDVEDITGASGLVQVLSRKVGWFKVGSRLFTREGPRVCELITESGAGLFLDLKFHDIPNTVYGAVRSALATGARMLTVHASGGEEMMRAAVGALEDSGKEGVLLLGVTVLTHFSEENFIRFFSSTRSHREMVLALAEAAASSGLGGVVASAREAAAIKSALGDGFKVVTPGIRLEGVGGKDDQKRVVTPEAALAEGADYIVVGRPIIGAQDPAAAADLFRRKLRASS